MLWTHTEEVLGLNLSQNTSYITQVLHNFLQSNAGIAPQFGHDHFSPNPSVFINHSSFILHFNTSWEVVDFIPNEVTEFFN
jgi:hypothetical protein